MGPKFGHVEQYLPEFGRPHFVLIVHAPGHAADKLFDARPQPCVEGLLQFADFLEVGLPSLHPTLHVENFQMADAALAVPQQFRHVFGLKILGAQHQPVTGVKVGQLPRQFLYRKLHERGQIPGRGGVAQVRHFRMPQRGKPLFQHVLHPKGVQGLEFGARFFRV